MSKKKKKKQKTKVKKTIKKKKLSKEDEIRKLESKLAKLKTDEIDPLIIQKNEEFKKIGLMFKVQDFFAVYKVEINSYEVHILKEGTDKLTVENIERSFILKEITEELDNDRARAREIKKEE